MSKVVDDIMADVASFGNAMADGGEGRTSPWERIHERISKLAAEVERLRGALNRIERGDIPGHANGTYEGWLHLKSIAREALK